MRLRYTAIFLLLLIAGRVLSQNASSSRTTFFSTSFIQIKEQANYGLVFRGPAIDFGMKWNKPVRKQTFTYEYKFGLGFPLAKEIIGLNFSFKPVDLSYLWTIPAGGIDLQAGPAFKMQYDAQFYPDLQSGYDFWLTSYSTGIKLAAAIPTNKGNISMNLYSSVAGFTSRTEPYTNPYFFELGLGETIRDAHSNFRFSGPGRFINSSMEIKYKSIRNNRLSIAYILDYTSYNESYRLRMLNHSLRLIINAKK